MIADAREMQGNTYKPENKCACLNARSKINKKNELNIMVDDNIYDQKVDVWVMGHLVTQFQGQILHAAANNRVCGHA